MSHKYFDAKSTATAAGTTTLDATSAVFQVFTGSTTQTVKLPSLYVLAGATYTIVNNSSGNVSVQSSAANGIVTLNAGKAGIFIALQDAPTSSTHWQSISPTSSVVSGTTAARDGNSQLWANGFFVNYDSTATAAGTTTLTNASKQVQVFTGSTTQTVKLPTSNINPGFLYTVINQSSGNVTVQSSGANTISTLTANTGSLFLALKASPTAAADWQAIT